MAEVGDVRVKAGVPDRYPEEGTMKNWIRNGVVVALFGALVGAAVVGGMDAREDRVAHEERQTERIDRLLRAERAAATAPAETPTGPAAAPERVVIPALEVTARIDEIGLDGGTLTPPPDPERVGWWTGSGLGDRATPLLLTGHSVRAGGGAFDDLDTLEAGDAVLVHDRAAQTTTYTVRSVVTRSKAWLEAHAADLFAADGRPRLVLVTCADYDDGSWRSNVIVEATPR